MFMISLTKFKQSLGAAAKGMTDEELEQLRSEMYQLADMAFEIWVKRNQTNLSSKE